MNHELFGTRVCHDCGRPTPNYRCDSCWKKRRGFGADMEITSAEDKETYTEGVLAAKKRRKKAPLLAPAPEIFVPLTKYGKSPPPPPPGEQKRIAPAMPANGHAGQWPRPANGFWIPKKRAKESMMEEKKTLTIRELADRIGVSVKDVQNAKVSTTRNPNPGSKNYTIREYMREQGITWEMIVAGRPGPRKITEPATLMPERATMEAPRVPDVEDIAPISEEAAPEEAASEEAASEEAAAALPEEAPAHEKAMEEIFADFGNGQDRSVFTMATPQPISSFSMEELVMEIIRRMPRAEVVLR
jgi:hypothetical protein